MFRKTFRKIHIILGLISGLILIIIGVSGTVLSFEKEIMNSINKDTYTVPLSNKEKIPIIKLLEGFGEKKPNLEITAISFSNIKSSSLYFKTIKRDGDKKQVRKYYINPYTGEFLAQEKGEDFFRKVERLHRTLLLNDIGKNLVGFSVFSLLILIFSGVVMSFSRLKKHFFKSFTFSFKSKGQHFLKISHSFFAMWLMPFYLFSALSGLNWSYSWYNKTFYKIMGVEKVQRTTNKSIKLEKGSKLDEVGRAITIFEREVRNKYIYSLVKIPENGTVYKFLYLDENAKHRRERNKLVLDIKTKKILKHERFENKSLNEQIMISMLTLHTGEYFGIFGQTILFISSLLLAFLVITGFLIYTRKKRKQISQSNNLCDF